MLIHSPEALALALIAMRKKRNLSQSTIGELVGLKQQTISAFENNPNGTKLESLFRILSAVGADIEIQEKNKANLVANKRWTEEW